MSLFHPLIIKAALASLHESKVEEAWRKFTTHFHNPLIQDNIRSLHEEQYQEGFLIDLFVNVFKYTKNPSINFNLTTELKNVKNAKKTDGAILKRQQVLAVIELKGTNTTDLSKVEQQAFAYKNNQSKCVYVITSNFEKLRFYIHDAVEFEEFNLFTLTKERFKLLYFCLAQETLCFDVPEIAKNQSISDEETITKNLYKHYAEFRSDIFKSIQSLNPNHEKLLLFKKTQKLLDRFLFIFFAEDKSLIPPKSVEKIITDWRELEMKHGIKIPLYDKYKTYFGYLNTGKKDEYDDIFPYNGGLFAPDELLESLKIDDRLLARHTAEISRYDFDSEVSVNILGHIFEHSMNEFEEIQAEIEGREFEKTTTRRKKDGVFYTPKYITKYIVDNTVGKLCDKKKQELGIIEENYITEDGKPIKDKKIIPKLQNTLQSYRTWLLQITICDPACGSGAFLNQALEFLINEHEYLNELEKKWLGTTVNDPNLENKILKNNIFGVDINEESVEIAKLSLWIRTAQKGRKLTTLNDNFKVGNSLISDTKIAENKAFNWQKEFPQIFEKGGFDVIIGNPPYLRMQGLKNAYPKLTTFYENTYQSATGNYDIYVLFIEKSLELINDNGQVSFILPHKFLISEFGEGIRKFLAEQKAVDSLLHFGEHLVFEVTTYTCILNLTKKQNDFLYFKYINPLEINLPFEWDKMNTTNLHSDKWNLMSQTKINLFNKLNQQPFTAKDIFSKIFTGLQTSADSIYLIEGIIEDKVLKGYSKSLDKIIEIEKELVKPILKGQDVSKYTLSKNQHFVIFPYWLDNEKAKEMTEEEIATQFPKGYTYLKENETELRNREKGKMDKEGWFLYIYPKSLSSFEQPKIITPEISLGTNMTFDEGVMYHSTTIYSFVLKEPSLETYKFYLSVLNSSLMWFYLMNTGTVLRGGYFRFKTKYLFPFPLPSVPQNTQPFIDLANKMMSLNDEFLDKKNRFIRRLQDNFRLKSFSKKLENFHELSFAEFIQEVGKKIDRVKDVAPTALIPLYVQDEWEKYFINSKKDILALHNEIQNTDNQIDNLVFELYGLTEEEIMIVKGLD